MRRRGCGQPGETEADCNGRMGTEVQNDSARGIPGDGMGAKSTKQTGTPAVSCTCERRDTAGVWISDWIMLLSVGGHMRGGMTLCPGTGQADYFLHCVMDAVWRQLWHMATPFCVNRETII